MRTTSSCARPSAVCRKPSGSKSGCGVCQNASRMVFWVIFGGARAIRMPAHAVDHDKQSRVLGHCRGHAVLVFFARSEQ